MIIKIIITNIKVLKYYLKNLDIENLENGQIEGGGIKDMLNKLFNKNITVEEEKKSNTDGASKETTNKNSEEEEPKVNSEEEEPKVNSEEEEPKDPNENSKKDPTEGGNIGEEHLSDS